MNNVESKTLYNTYMQTRFFYCRVTHNSSSPPPPIWHHMIVEWLKQAILGHMIWIWFNILGKYFICFYGPAYLFHQSDKFSFLAKHF